MGGLGGGKGEVTGRGRGGRLWGYWGVLGWYRRGVEVLGGVHEWL